MLLRIGTGPTSPPSVDEQRNQRYRRYKVALTVLFLCWMALEGWLWYRASLPLASIAEVGTPRVLTPSDLCPGDTLIYEFDVSTKGPVVFDIDTTVWRVSPPNTLIFSTPSRAVVAKDMTYTEHRVWPIPRTYTNTETGLTATWLPGKYERHIAVGTTSRSTLPSIQVIPFTIKENCQ